MDWRSLLSAKVGVPVDWIIYIGVFPDNTDDPIIYPVALRANAKPDAVRYFSFLRTQTAKSVFEKYGFNFLVKPTS